jgi:hypothetical protein
MRIFLMDILGKATWMESTQQRQDTPGSKALPQMILAWMFLLGSGYGSYRHQKSSNFFVGQPVITLSLLD